MEIWPWAFIIGIKFITLKPLFKNNNPSLASPTINKKYIQYKESPIFKPKISPLNSRVYC